MPRLSDAERNQSIGMLSNSSINHVAAFFNTSRKTIRLLHRRMQQTGTVKDRARTGRPKKTTDADDTEEFVYFTSDRGVAQQVKQRHVRRTFPIAISRQTVGRRLKTYGLLCRRPVRRTRLTQRHIPARLNWARAHRRWTLRQWETCFFRRIALPP